MYCIILCRYTYIPTLEFLERNANPLPLHQEVRKFVASFVSFAYVYVWHGVMLDVLVWAALNFLGITFERVGSYIRRLCDSVWVSSMTLYLFVQLDR